MGIIKLTHNQETQVDDADVQKLSVYNWKARKAGPYWRAVFYKYTNGRTKTIFMSRFIMDCPEGLVVDHISGDTLDNRRSNLRICTRAENARNRKISKNNKIGYKGVSWDKQSKKYQARLALNKKNITLGYRDDPKDAYELYLEGCRKYFGEFARKSPL